MSRATERRVGRTAQRLGRIARGSAQRRGVTLASIAVLMMVLGAGITQLEFRDDPNSAMPKGHPNTEASDELVATFPGASFTGAVFVEVAPDKWRNGQDQLPFRPEPQGRLGSGQDQLQGTLNDLIVGNAQGQNPGTADFFPGPQNITDEVYMRAMEELTEFLMAEVDELQYAITLPSQIKLVNYTNTGVPHPIPGEDPLQPPDESAFSMPGTDAVGAQQFSSSWQSYWQASLDSIKTIVSPDWSTTRFGLIFEPGDKTLNEVGADLYDAVDDYRDAIRTCDGIEGFDGPCQLQWNVFHPESITVDPRAPQSAAAYLTDTTLEDLLKLGPYVAGFILLSLFLAFRRVGTIAAMMLPMGLAGVGVLGVFGLIDLPIHSVSLLVFPILMGNGIDFAIHMATAYGNARTDGADPIDAAEKAGQSAGTPLFIATLTTVAGMMLLVFSPNQLLTELGIAILLGMVLLLGISLTALPAALTWTKPAALRRSILGRILVANARFWHKGRIVGGLVAVAAIVGGIVAAPALQSLIIGTPAAFFPEGDPQREDFEHTNEIYYAGKEDLVSNSLVLRGDLTTPESMALLRAMESEIGALPFVRTESAVNIHFALVSWIQVRGGTAGAPVVIAQETADPGSTFPETQEEIEFLIDEMFSTPLATYASFFIENDGEEPEYQIGNMLVEIHQPDNLEDLELVWEELSATIERLQREHPDADMEIHLAGGTALGYLFTKEELPYLQVAGIIGILVTGGLVLLIRRDARDAMTVAAVVGTTGVAWLGALWLLDIPLSIALVVPVVMVAAIGSDYALHLRYDLRAEGIAAWDTIGRAVVFSAITDIGAFLIFSRMRYGLLADATTATAVALALTLLSTLILVPSLMSRKEATTEVPA